MVGMGSSERLRKVVRRVVRNSAVLNQIDALVSELYCGFGTPGLRVLFPRHGRALLEVCARTEGRVDVAGYNEGPGGTRAPFRGNRLDVLSQSIEKISRDGIACVGSVQEQNTNAPRSWGGDVLGLDYGIVAARAKSRDRDAVGEGGSKGGG